MPLDYRGVRGRSQDSLTYLGALVHTKHGGQVRQILRTLVQGVLRHATRRPLSPTISKVVMDAVIRHWVTVMMPSEAVTGGIGLTIIYLAAYFYAQDSLVASIQTERL